MYLESYLHPLFSPGPGRFAQLALEELAGSALGQLVLEINSFGTFAVAKLRPAVIDQRLLGSDCAWFEHDAHNDTRACALNKIREPARS
jgi:hypothetical protein